MMRVRTRGACAFGEREKRRGFRPGVLFFTEIFRKPFATGAIAPSSRALAELIVSLSGVEFAGEILELGAGTGIFTEEIVARKRPGARVLAVESNSKFAAHLRSRYAGIRVVCGCASLLMAHAHDHGFSTADSVVSALPWTNFPPDRQAAILRSIRQLLSERGKFTTVACFGPHFLPRGRQFRDLMRETFSHIRASHVVFGNLPPAFIYECSR